MKPNELKAFILEKGSGCEEKPIQHGVQLRCNDGEVFIVYDTGKVVVGGKRTALSSAVEDLLKAPGPERARVAPAVDQEIFIVYGHDTAARDELELMLRRAGLSPIVLANLPAAGDTIIEKLRITLDNRAKQHMLAYLLHRMTKGTKWESQTNGNTAHGRTSY